MNLRPGQKILEIGPGPGRLLLPAARFIKPLGQAVGIDIQSRMIERLERRANEKGIDNLTAILGDASKPQVAENTFDLVFLVTTLGEIPDRAATIRECFAALKSGGVLSITKLFGDPHYQSLASVKRLAEDAGFRFQRLAGRWWFYTVSFEKP